MSGIDLTSSGYDVAPLDCGAAVDIEAMHAWPRIMLGGLPITVIDRETTARGFMALAKARRRLPGRPFFSTSANGEVLSRVGRDPAAAEDFLAADQIHADGMPMVHFSRLRRRRLPERVATTDLVHTLARHAARQGVTFFFLGASEEVNREAVARMQRAYPGLVFAGRHHGYFKPDDEEAVIAAINAARPDILFVGLGVPLEQRFVRRNIDRLKGVAVVKTCGGLFDFLSGRRPRAPQLMQKAGFEWLWRAALEPRRLGPRYLFTNGRAIVQLLLRSR